MADLRQYTHVDLEIRDRMLYRIQVLLAHYQTVCTQIPANIYSLFLNCIQRFMKDIEEIGTSQRLREFAPSIHNGLDEIERILCFHISQRVQEINTASRPNI
ncbi:unnamed protein product [Caenorhabditis angaria]|uniref:Uncharacterized protein n=1 Tax=Caenorhabditis angaria TaxID=860376 RepID=A0A9P1J3D1_9PELO|nr:unnamed protein product [Caenorhabditis angaria]